MANHRGLTDEYLLRQAPTPMLDLLQSLTKHHATEPLPDTILIMLPPLTSILPLRALGQIPVTALQGRRRFREKTMIIEPEIILELHHRVHSTLRPIRRLILPPACPPNPPDYVKRSMHLPTTTTIPMLFPHPTRMTKECRPLRCWKSLPAG